MRKFIIRRPRGEAVMRNKPAFPAKKGAQKGVLGRVIKSVFHYYPKMMTIALICIILNAVISSIPSIFMQKIFSIIEGAQESGTLSLGWDHFGAEITKYMLILIAHSWRGQ